MIFNLDAFLNTIITNIVTGLSVGISSAVVNYFITKHIIARLEKLDKKWEERDKKHGDTSKTPEQ